jgi:hypothetical protein
MTLITRRISSTRTGLVQPENGECRPRGSYSSLLIIGIVTMDFVAVDVRRLWFIVPDK